MQCPKCGGTGYIAAYSYVAGGLCFCCNGKGTVDKVMRERKSRTPQTPERKAELAAKREREIISSEIDFAAKRASKLGATGTAILARYARELKVVRDVRSARTYSDLVGKACHRHESINWLIDSAIDADCAHWSSFCYSADEQE
jgi:RecJ-like exonuclease